MEDYAGKWVYVHRLVAEAFIPNLTQMPEIDHINGDRMDNNIDNLQWVTSKENKANPVTRIRMSSGKIKKRKPVSQFNKYGEWIADYESIIQATRMTGITQGSISMCCRGKIKTCGGGYVFKYKENKVL